MSEAELLEGVPTLYDRDFYAWGIEQAELLRRRQFSRLDLPNLIEEVEALSASDRRALRSSYRLVIAHLLKWEHQPSRRSRSWEKTIGRERDNIAEGEGDSKALADEAAELVREAYGLARRQASRETKTPLAAFPPECPYTLEQLRDDQWLPE